MNKYHLGIGITLMTLLMSCIGNKQYVYLQESGKTKKDSVQNIEVKPYNYKLQPGDILYISLTTEDDRMNKIFVPATSMNVMQGQTTTGSVFYFTGFTLSSQGEIELPYLGKMKLSGNTLEEAKFLMEIELKKYFKNYFLNIKIADFKFSVLGFVNRPGQYFFNQNKVSILEAIAQAGDLQSLASRKKLQLIRQYPDGYKVHELDITDRSMMNSPYWYIQPNDVLYVVPLKARRYGDVSNLQSTLSVVAPLLSTMLMVINTYIILQKL